MKPSRYWDLTDAKALFSSLRDRAIRWIKSPLNLKLKSILRLVGPFEEDIEPLKNGGQEETVNEIIRKVKKPIFFYSYTERLFQYRTQFRERCYPFPLEENRGNKLVMVNVYYDKEFPTMADIQGYRSEKRNIFTMGFCHKYEVDTEDEAMARFLAVIDNKNFGPFFRDTISQINFIIPAAENLNSDFQLLQNLSSKPRYNPWIRVIVLPLYRVSSEMTKLANTTRGFCISGEKLFKNIGEFNTSLEKAREVLMAFPRFKEEDWDLSGVKIEEEKGLLREISAKVRAVHELILSTNESIELTLKYIASLEKYLKILMEDLPAKPIRVEDLPAKPILVEKLPVCDHLYHSSLLDKYVCHYTAEERGCFIDYGHKLRCDGCPQNNVIADGDRLKKPDLRLVQKSESA